MSTFHDLLNKPVDVQAEIQAYEEANQTPEVIPNDDTPEPDLAGGPEGPEPTEPESDPDVQPKQHPGNAWSTMRAKVKAAEERARQMEQEKARLEGEMRAWQTYQQQQQAQQAPQQPQQEYIDPTTNPIEALQRVQQESQQLKEYIQQQDMIGQVQQAYRADAARYMQQNPDFRDAYTHVVNARKTQLELEGYDPARATQQVYQEEMNLARSALQRGISPAELMYQYATRIYNYQPKGQQAAQETPRDESGRFVSIEKEQQKAAAAVSISRGGTATPRSDILPPEEGAKLTGKEFDDWYDKWMQRSGGGKKILWR